MSYDAIVIGAGAAGMMCAIEAGRRGKSVLLIDHYRKLGEKIRIYGVGRGNFECHRNQRGQRELFSQIDDADIRVNV